jgi:hypothetical protein
MDPLPGWLIQGIVPCSSQPGNLWPHWVDNTLYVFTDVHRREYAVICEFISFAYFLTATFNRPEAAVYRYCTRASSPGGQRWDPRDCCIPLLSNTRLAAKGRNKVKFKE